MNKKLKKGISSLLTVAMLVAPTGTAFANNESNQNLPEITIQQEQELTENIELLENFLVAEGTSVVAELEKGKIKTAELLETTDDLEEKEKINNLINAYDNMISKYNNYEICKATGISLQGVYNPVYSAAVAAVAAYFTKIDCVLSAELLLYMADESTGGRYSPVNINGLYSTSTYNQLKQKAAGYTSSSHKFESDSTTAEKDAYYAIHLFDCRVTSSSIIISDMYDYAHDQPWTSVEGIAVNTMATAQAIGVLVPFETYIVLYK